MASSDATGLAYRTRLRPTSVEKRGARGRRAFETIIVPVATPGRWQALTEHYRESPIIGSIRRGRLSTSAWAAHGPSDPGKILVTVPPVPCEPLSGLSGQAGDRPRSGTIGA
eukprot:764562-Hanusia_phi.AAC.1